MHKAVNIIDRISGKKVLIWGYGREGVSTEHFLRKCCNADSIDVYEGDRGGINESDFDLIIKSPGIVMNDENPKYTSQTELFLEQFRDQIVGITGTKGKSTTSAMLYTVLKECSHKNVVLLGNIGQPCLDYFEEITEDTIIVYEMSCHQLAHARISPHVAVFLNFFEEHLDYYATVEKYFEAKSHITKYQVQDDHFLVGNGVPPIDTRANIYKIEQRNDKDIVLNILGKHNKYNAQFVYTIAVNILGCDENSVLKSMNNFKGLPHRLEYIGNIDGVIYFDDSISTIPEATISACESISNVHTVLIGGMDRGINYDKLIEYIKKNKHIIFIFSYASGRRIYQLVSDCKNCYYAIDLKEAVRLAKQLTSNGKACVLSPAAASYGYFKNFEERGAVFKEYVLNDTKDN